MRDNTRMPYTLWSMCNYGIGQSCPSSNLRSLLRTRVAEIYITKQAHHCRAKGLQDSFDDIPGGIEADLIPGVIRSLTLRKPGHDQRQLENTLRELLLWMRTVYPDGYPVKHDRQKYEFIMALAGAIEKCNAPFSCDGESSQGKMDLQYCLSTITSITDPFYYARAAGVFVPIAQRKYTYSRKGLNDFILNLSDRFMGEIEQLSKRLSDGVHEQHDYVVFAGSLLGHALLQMGGTDDSDRGIYHALYKEVKYRFDSKLSVDSKASQLSFYRTLHHMSCTEDQQKELMNVAHNYIVSGDHSSPYAWLRLSYLFYDMNVFGMRQTGVYNSVRALLRSVYTRATVQAFGANMKYDNMVLRYCYGVVLLRCSNDHELATSVEKLDARIAEEAHLLLSTDMEKILFSWSDGMSNQVAGYKFVECT